MIHQPSRRGLAIWLFTAAVSVPLGWWAARALAQPVSDLVWASLAFGPPWVVYRLVAGDFYWNPFFFGFLPAVLAFEAPTEITGGLIHGALLVALAPLVAYGIIGLTNAILFSGAAVARLARGISDPDRDAIFPLDRLGLWLRAGLGSGMRWYAIWLGGAAVGLGLGLATQALARAAGIRPEAPAVALTSRAVVGLVSASIAWMLLWWWGASPTQRERR